MVCKLYIRKVKINNYCSFDETVELVFDKKINFVVGKNNSGKSSFLQAIAGRIISNPHRSFESSENLKQPSAVSYELSISEKEFDLHMELNRQTHIPIPNSWVYHEQLGYNLNSNQAIDCFNKFRTNEISLRSQVLFHEHGQRVSKENYYITCIGDNPIVEGNFTLTIKKTSSEHDFDIVVSRSNMNEPFPGFYDLVRSKIYLFGAFRQVSSEGVFNHSIYLEPDGSNLPQVLLSLQSNRKKYERYVELVRKVFPDIKWVSCATQESGVQIRIWTIEPETERDDLSIPLSQSGTGVGQVLAIIYVILTSENVVVAIDEPTSFLHPSAARSLMTIISRSTQSIQFVIATHSPETISILRPNNIFMLSKSDQLTTIRPISASDYQSVRSMLREIGSRLSDVFSADEIIWVEGPTEELCFPRIIEHFEPNLIQKFSIRALFNTGDLEAKKPGSESVWEIYRRLSAPNQLMPRVVAFSLDMENRTDEKIADLKKRSKGLVHFLPRKMYENYLLDTDIITNYLNKLPSFIENPVSTAVVEKWFCDFGLCEIYLKGQKVEAVFSDKWFMKVYGAKLLHNLFSDLSNAKEKFSKVKHSYDITCDILDKKPHLLYELKSYVLKLAKLSDYTEKI